MDKIEKNDINADESVDIFKQALEATADSVVITDVDGNIEWVNSAYEVLTGYSTQDVKGRNPRILKSGKQDPSYYEKLWQTIKAGEEWHGELWNRRKDGVLYLEEQSITPVKNNKGIISHFIAIKRDITKQYKLQNQLSMSQRIEAIAKLTAGVAHNFNNKLASILGYAELAVEESEQYSNDDLTDYLQEISVAGKFARDLVRQMMAFSRNEVSEKQSVDLADVIKESIKILTSSLPSTIRLLTDLDDVNNVDIDPVRLHQMILSLVINSSEAMDGKGVITIAVHKQKLNGEICNSCHEVINGNYVALCIRDTGKGINSKDIENIFLPFFTTREMDGGTGMGLSALHGMLHDQGGHVLVDSVVDQYAEFRLLLHESDLDSRENELNGSSQKINKSKENTVRIMVVDDEESVANVLAEILRNYNYEITVETNSKEALKRFNKGPDMYDLIITDSDMPNLTGIELAKAINDIKSDVPVLLITGYNVDSIDNDSENIKAVLTKPFETANLIKNINRLV